LVVISLIETFATLLLNDSVIPIPPTVARGLRTLRVILRIARILGRLVRAWHLAQVAASARNIGIARPIKVITKKDVLMLSYGDDQEGMLLEVDTQDGKGVAIAEEYRDKWSKARIRRLYKHGRVTVHLALPGDSQPVTASQMDALFTWKTDDDEQDIVSFRTIVPQPTQQQVQLKLEVLRSTQVGFVFVYYENGTLEMQRWNAHEVDIDDPNDGVSLAAVGAPKDLILPTMHK